LYLFLVRHPDVVVSMWETLKLSNLQLRQTGPKSFKIVEADGTTGTIEYLHSTHDMQIVYVEGSYKGGLIAKTTKGSGLVILRSGYVREPDGRYYITNRLDAFLSVEPGAVEVVTKTLQPVMTRVAENNFTQTLAFIGSLSRTCEVNPGGVERLAGRLQHLQPEVQQEMVKLAGGVAERAPKAAATSKTAPPAHLPLAAQTVEPPARR
jgi:hypothetical protein